MKTSGTFQDIQAVNYPIAAVLARITHWYQPNTPVLVLVTGVTVRVENQQDIKVWVPVSHEHVSRSVSVRDTKTMHKPSSEDRRQSSKNRRKVCHKMREKTHTMAVNGEEH